MDGADALGEGVVAVAVPHDQLAGVLVLLLFE